jgi:hypothetical protein
MRIKPGLKELVLSSPLPLSLIAGVLFLGYNVSATSGTVVEERVFSHAGNNHYELQLVDGSGREQVFQFHGKDSNVYELRDDISVGDSVTVFAPAFFRPDEYGIKHSSTHSLWNNETNQVQLSTR